MDFLKKFSGPPTKDQFAEAVIAEFRRAGDPRELKYDQENFRLKHATGEEMNLTSLFQEHCQLPPKVRQGQLTRIVQAFLTAREELPELFDEARSNLRPKVWLRSSFDRMVSESSKLTEQVVKLAGEAIQPISNRASVNAERVNELMA